ncbi:hypothetical protein [Planktothrix sp. FACHB-1365]|uniref:hypothetical protein n=1 Tax=Planktothrix sp. FACHB-1365 TaxID=2692855 RepID=UPI00168681FF|nr:hypothetical protein [Planktothrix sp. FACHB-1365]MBD2485925.1 hypothetical protein [Planktothrix sp. FACHB-1365]
MHSLERRLNLELECLFQKFRQAQPDSPEQQRIFDAILQFIVENAQRYPFKSRERRIITGILWSIMTPALMDESLESLPPSKRESIREKLQKPTDSLARTKLEKIKAFLKKKYGNSPFNTSFDDCWNEAFSNAQKEFLTKLDIYYKGIDYPCFEKWQKFLSQIDSLEVKTEENLQPLCQDLIQELNKFQNRLQNRLKKRKDFSEDSLQRVAPYFQSFYAQLIDSILNNTLLQNWDIFCHNIRDYYEPKSVWNWFSTMLIHRYLDVLRKLGKTIAEPADAPVSPEKKGDKWDRVTPQAKSQNPPEEIIELIREDAYGIFSSKSIDKPNCEDINFRAIFLLKLNEPEPTLAQIEEYFGNRVNAQTTISSFYSRCYREYFRPFFQEWLNGDLGLPLTDERLQEIQDDVEGKFQRKKMPNYPEINFQQVILNRSNSGSWQQVTQNLNVPIKDLIYFYLDCLRRFKLVSREKTRQRLPKKKS